MLEFSEALDQVPWHSLSAQSDGDQSIPDAVVALTSGDADVRKRGYWNLDNHIVVQGGLHEAAFYVVPFLIQICKTGKTHGACETLDLLYEIASGGCSFQRHVGFATVVQPFQYYIPVDGQPTTPLIVATRYAIGRQIEALLPIMTSENSAERQQCSELLLLFPEYGAALNDHLIGVADTISDRRIKREIQLFLSELRQK